MMKFMPTKFQAKTFRLQYVYMKKRKEPRLVSKLGVVKRYSMPVPDLSVTGVIEVGDDDFLVATTANLIRQNFTGEVLSRHSYRFSLVAYSRELNVVVGVLNKEEGGSLLTVLSPDELMRPLLANFDLGMDEVKRIELFSKSQCVLVVNSAGYRCWRFARDGLSVVFELFHEEMEFIGVDLDRELVFVRLGDKLKCFTAEGENEIMEEMHAIQGPAIEVIGEHVVYGGDKIVLYDRVTRHSFCCADFREKPWGWVAARRGVFAVVFEKHAVVFDIRVPWQLWTKVKGIRRFVKCWSKTYVVTEHFDKSVHFLSMRDRSELFSFPESGNQLSMTGAGKLTQRPQSSPVNLQKGKLNGTLPRLNSGKGALEDDNSVFSFFYDEGFLLVPTLLKSKSALQVKKFTTNSKHRMLKVNNSGVLSVLGMKTSPFVELKRKIVFGTCITICYFEGKWAYAVMSSRKSELLILDGNNFLILEAYEIKSKPVQALYYYYPCNSVVVQTLNEVILFDPKQGGIVSRGLATYSDASALFGDYLYIGLDNGIINKVIVANKKVRSDLMIDTGVSSKVVDFAFSKTNWICALANGSIIIWDYFDEPILMMEFPFNVHSVRFFGKERDILLATDEEIMVLPGKHKKEEKKVTMPLVRQEIRAPRPTKPMNVTTPMCPVLEQPETKRHLGLAQTQPVPHLTMEDIFSSSDELVPTGRFNNDELEARGIYDDGEVMPTQYRAMSGSASDLEFKFDLGIGEWSGSQGSSTADDERLSYRSALFLQSTPSESFQSTTRSVSFAMPTIVGLSGREDDKLDTKRKNLRITRAMAAFGDDAESDSDNAEHWQRYILPRRQTVTRQLRYGYSPIPNDLFTTFEAKPAPPPVRSTAAVRRQQDSEELFIRNYFSPK